MPDSDGDGIGDADEVNYGTNPNDADTDNDGLPDGWEVSHNLDPLDPTGDNGGVGDPDDDGLNNYEEYINGTDPHNSDSDGDQLPDGWEVHYQFDPLDPIGENGANGDPDEDDLTNLEEYEKGTHPRIADTDNDGIPDGEDPRVDIRSWLPKLYESGD